MGQNVSDGFQQVHTTHISHMNNQTFEKPISLFHTHTHTTAYARHDQPDIKKPISLFRVREHTHAQLHMPEVINQTSKKPISLVHTLI